MIGTKEWMGRARASVLVILLMGVMSASAQVPVPAPPAEAGKLFALTGATLYPVSAPPIENGTLLWRDGVIESIGAGIPVPADAERIDLAGLSVYPGLISTKTVLGLVEINSVRQTSDHTEIGKYHPQVRAEVALNPDSELIPVTRANGILSALVIPGGGRVRGKSALIRLDGWTWEDLTIAAPIGMHISWPGQALGSRRGKEREEQRRKNEAEIAELSDYFAQARAYAKAHAAAGSADVPRKIADVEWEAMRPVVEGRLPVFIHANDIRQITTALDWTAEQGLSMVLVGGDDAPLVAERLRERDIPVIVGGTLRLPGRDFDPYDSRFTLPLRLSEAGLSFCIATKGGAAHEFRLPHHAAMAMSYGLPEVEALKAITLYPAEILGLGEQLGSLEAGKEATLIVTDGSPLDIRSNVLRAFIRGREISLESRQTRLYEKYKQRPLPGARK